MKLRGRHVTKENYRLSRVFYTGPPQPGRSILVEVGMTRPASSSSPMDADLLLLRLPHRQSSNRRLCQ